MTDVNVGVFIINAILMAAVFLFTYIASIFLHEIGHLLILRKFSKNAKVQLKKYKGKIKLTAGEEIDYLKLNDKELNQVYIAGIFLGLAPVCLFTIINSWGMVLIIVYLLGCNSDFKKLRAIKKGN